MKTTKEGIDLLHSFESCELEAYECQASKRLPAEKKFYTIGWGSTFYQDGSKIKKGDKITQDEADRLFDFVLSKFEKDVLSLVKSNVNNNQFSALVSFAYNVGSDIDSDTIAEGLGDSTLLKKVNANPNDPSIEKEFMKWINAGGQPSNGLKRRREAESKLYFS